MQSTSAMSMAHSAMYIPSDDGRIHSGEDIHYKIAHLEKATKKVTLELMKGIKSYFDAERKKTSIDAEKHSIVELRMKDAQFTPDSYANLCAMYSKAQTKMFGFHAGGSANSYRKILERMDGVARDSVQRYVEGNFAQCIGSAFNDVNLDPTDPKGEISDHQAQTALVRFCTIVKSASVDQERRGTKSEEKQYYNIFNQMDFDGENKIQEKADIMLSLSQHLKDRDLDHGVDQYVLLALNSYISSGYQFLTRVFPNRGSGYETMRGSLRVVAKEKVYENPQPSQEDEIYRVPTSVSAEPPELPSRSEYMNVRQMEKPVPKPRSNSSLSGGSTSSMERKNSAYGDRPTPAPRRKSVQQGPQALPTLTQVRDSIASVNLNESADLK